MGRTPTRNAHLPKGMRARHRGATVYYYLDTGAKPRREIALGADYTAAVQKWAELTTGAKAGAIVTFRHVSDRYTREVLQKKALETQKDNLRELKNLLRIFDAPPQPIDDIEPVDVRKYLDWRKAAPVRANREKALLSHIFNFARAAGLTAKPNPCAGIKGHVETGRDAYIDDVVFAAVWDAAEQPLRDALDMAYLTGQRPADVRKMTRADLRDGAISVVQNKRGKKLRVEVIGQLAAVMARIDARKVAGLTLICDARGRAMSKAMLRGAFDRARDAAVIARPELLEQIRAFQFRDLRAKAGTDTEESRGMAAAKDQLGHSSEVMTAKYVRHRRGKLVPPTK
jgi:integrase